MILVEPRGRVSGRCAQCHVTLTADEVIFDDEDLMFCSDVCMDKFQEAAKEKGDAER